jgi:EpsI family protein
VIKLLVALAFLGLNVYTYHFLAHDSVQPPRETFDAFPLQLGEWECQQNEPLDPKVLNNLGATDTLVCNYLHSDGTQLGFYVGYHGSQVREEGGGAGENSIHPPAHCLPGSGWDIIDSRTVELDIAGLRDPHPEAKRLIIAKGEYRQLVYYWYQMQGRSVAEDWQKILYVGYDRARTSRTDGALVRFTLPLPDGLDAEAEADARFREFAALTMPLLPRFVPD